MKKTFAFTLKYFLIAFFTSTSIYFYAHIAEEVLYVDLPIVNGVSTTSIPQLLLSDSATGVDLSEKERFGFFGKPSILRIPRFNQSLDLENVAYGKSWTLSYKTLGMLVYGPSISGRLGDSVIFTSISSRLLNAINAVTEGDRIVILTDKGWRYSYRISGKILIDKDSGFIPHSSMGSKIFFLREMPDLNHVLVVEATYLSLEEINV